MMYTYQDNKDPKERASNHIKHHRDTHFETQVLELDVRSFERPHEFPVVILLVTEFDIQVVCLPQDHAQFSRL